MGGMLGKFCINPIATLSARPNNMSCFNTNSPGRFFVAHELKMILAYLTQNYEIKHLEERPKPMWIGQTIVPPLDAKIEIKRRKGTVSPL